MQKPTDSDWTHLLTGVSGQSADSVGRLLHRAKRLALIENKVLEAVPEPERQHCSLSNIRPLAQDAGHELVLIVKSAAWASRLRFHVATIKERLSTESVAITAVKIVVEQAAATPNKPPQTLIRSAKGSTAVSQTASHIEHQPLADALSKLADTIKP